MPRYLSRITLLLVLLLAFLILPCVATESHDENSETAMGNITEANETTNTPTFSVQAPVSSIPAPNYTGKKISLDYMNADIRDVIKRISDVSGKNLVLSDDVKGKVTLKIKDVPWDQALDMVLASNGLGFVVSGNVLRVDKASTLRDERVLVYTTPY